MAKKSVAQFKVREGMPVGASVTLRGARMWEFLDRLITIAIPRIRDFRGLKATSFDGRGNYSMGVKEVLIFPEIDYDTVDVTYGFDITITTSAPTDPEAFELLLALGMPFAQEGRPRRRRLRRSINRSRNAGGLGPDGQDITESAPAAPREVQDPRVQPVPSLRPSPCLLPEVRHLPDLSA